MTVQSTSIKAYYDENSQHCFATQREFIYYVVQTARHPSLADITRLTKLKINAVTGRVNELEQEGRIHKESTKIDPFTHKEVNWYAPGPGKDYDPNKPKKSKTKKVTE